MQRINLQPFEQTELSREYTLRVVCRQSDESVVRSMLLHAIQQSKLVLQSIESSNVDDERVEVLAHIVTSERAKTKVERVVGRLSLEPCIFAAAWYAEARWRREWDSNPRTAHHRLQFSRLLH